MRVNQICGVTRTSIFSLLLSAIFITSCYSGDNKLNAKKEDYQHPTDISIETSSKNRIFEWLPGKEYDLSEKNIKSVEFINGAYLKYFDESQNESELNSIVAFPNGNSYKNVIVEDDNVSIISAFPSENKSVAAIVVNSCGGNSCREAPMHLVIPEKNFIRKYLIGDSPNKIKLVINAENKVVDGKAFDVYLRDDEFGSPVYQDLKYFPDVGFVHLDVKKYYLPVIGYIHPDEYFDNKLAREPLVKLVGLEKFRNLRNLMSGPGSITLLKGRYILLEGCKAHFCDSSFAAIIIDSLTDDIYWSAVDNKVSFGATKKIIKNDISFFNDLVSQVSYSRLKVNNKGEILFEKI